MCFHITTEKRYRKKLELWKGDIQWLLGVSIVVLLVTYGLN